MSGDLRARGGEKGRVKRTRMREGQRGRRREGYGEREGGEGRERGKGSECGMRERKREAEKDREKNRERKKEDARMDHRCINLCTQRTNRFLTSVIRVNRSISCM